MPATFLITKLHTPTSIWLHCKSEIVIYLNKHFYFSIIENHGFHLKANNTLYIPLAHNRKYDAFSCHLVELTLTDKIFDRNFEMKNENAVFIFTSFRCCMTFFLLQNTKPDILKYISYQTVLVPIEIFLKMFSFNFLRRKKFIQVSTLLWSVKYIIYYICSYCFLNN